MSPEAGIAFILCGKGALTRPAANHVAVCERLLSSMEPDTRARSALEVAQQVSGGLVLQVSKLRAPGWMLHRDLADGVNSRPVGQVADAVRVLGLVLVAEDVVAPATGQAVFGQPLRMPGAPDLIGLLVAQDVRVDPAAELDLVDGRRSAGRAVIVPGINGADPVSAAARVPKCVQSSCGKPRSNGVEW